MACNTLVNISNGDCGNNSGGISAVYIIDQSDITGTTVVASAHTITAIATDSGANFTTFEFRRNTGSLTSEPAVDLINGSSFFNNTLTLMFHRREASKSRALNILGEGQRYLAAIVLDANGKYWYTDYMQLNGGAEESGTARADGSKYTVTFVGESTNRLYEVDSSIIAALIA